MDKYRIDSHKLMYHVDRVDDWMEGKNIYPIYMEIAPSGSCNHRCTYCALDFMEYQPRFLETKLLKKRIAELGRLGVKSILYAGEGEPLLHKDMAGIANHTRRAGIDVAMATNGVFLKNEFVDKALGSITWIRISINGATKETYSKIHRCNPADFDKVIQNLRYAAKVTREKKFKCTLGVQLLLLPENWHEAVPLARLAKNIGMDYLVIKPYSQHPFSITTKYKNIKYGRYLPLAKELEKFNDKNFNVIFRLHTMQKWDEAKHPYRHCLALPFWAYIDSCGNVWGCSVYLSDERFNFGNIYEHTFKEIWEGKKRLELTRWAKEKMDTGQCRVNCRMDEINRYLWELKNPPAHVNFI